MWRRGGSGARCALLSLVAAVSFAACSHAPEPPPRPKAIVDLSPILDRDTVQIQYGTKAVEFFGLHRQSQIAPVRPQSALRTYGFTYFDILSHAGAHLDSSARLLRDGIRPADVPLDKLFGWSRIVDMRWHDRSSPITVADLETYNIRAGEIVILDIGYVPPGSDEWPQYAYLSDTASRWLADLGIRAIATDMPSLSSLRQVADLMEKGRPPEEIWSAHVPFFQADIPVIEGLVNLDAILGERRVYFVGFPLPLLDRSGAPMRAAALLYE